MMVFAIMTVFPILDPPVVVCCVEDMLSEMAGRMTKLEDAIQKAEVVIHQNQNTIKDHLNKMDLGVNQSFTLLHAQDERLRTLEHAPPPSPPSPPSVRVPHQDPLGLRALLGSVLGELRSIYGGEEEGERNGEDEHVRPQLARQIKHLQALLTPTDDPAVQVVPVYKWLLGCTPFVPHVKAHATKTTSHSVVATRRKDPTQPHMPEHNHVTSFEILSDYFGVNHSTIASKVSKTGLLQQSPDLSSRVSKTGLLQQPPDLSVR
jgi:hypothetical protein